MAGINGIGGVPEPISVRPASVRERKGDVQSTSSKGDGVAISSEAQVASELARIRQAGANAPDVRAERVAAARESLERGEYKRPEVVEEVAKRISKYL